MAAGFTQVVSPKSALLRRALQVLKARARFYTVRSSLPVASPAMSQSFVDIGAGQFVFREGQAGDDMYIIESGLIEIVRQVRGNDPIAVLEPGDFFGEMAILEDQPRFAGARAKGNCRLLKIDRAAFGELLQQNFEIAVRIMRKLAMRLRRTEQNLQQVSTELIDLKKRLTSETRNNVVPAPAPAAVVPVVVANAPTKLKMKLVHAATGAEFGILAELPESLIGRPDPVTGVTPEINLGPLDTQRTLSRRHAKILNEGGLTFLREEVGVTNGTFINDERIKTGVPTPIKIGDRLRCGAIEVDVQAI
jgi:CRP-like cAMP-binding protein